MDLAAIVDEVNRNVGDQADFVFQPGDISERGETDQFWWASDALSRLTLPCDFVRGDHDCEPGSFDRF